MSAQPIMFEFWCVAEMVSMQTCYTRQHDDNNTNKVLQSCCIELRGHTYLKAHFEASRKNLKCNLRFYANPPNPYIVRKVWE